MSKKTLIALAILALAIIASGCTTTQATTPDQYGNYLSELNSGNTAFTAASDHYGNASTYFSKGGYYQATREIKEARKGYDQALLHYQNMTAHASTESQRAYANALQAYARSCLYASTAYEDAYQDFSAGDYTRGNARLKDAADYIAQASKDHERAVALQPSAIV